MRNLHTLASKNILELILKGQQIDDYLGNTGGLKINNSSSCFLIHLSNLLTAEIAVFLLTNGLNMAYNSKPEVTCKNC